MRNAIINRNTGETQIRIGLELDGKGTADLCGGTGIGFFDHMLNAFARHGLFDLDVEAKGDLEVDGHHLVEDTGIVLGEAVRHAVGDNLCSALSICAGVLILSWILKTEKTVSARP